MSISSILDIIHTSTLDQWSERNKQAFDGLLGAPHGRYKRTAEKAFTVRAPEMSGEASIPFAAYIHPANPTSGRYSGMSFVIFPVDGQPGLIGLGVGTEGLAPDEAILGKPGHARKVQAICKWLNSTFGNGDLVAWAKHDPTRTDISIPVSVQNAWPEYKSIFDRYGREMYALYRPTSSRDASRAALTAFLDLLFEERGFTPMSGAQVSSDTQQNSWLHSLLPTLETSQVLDLLNTRRFVIIQGPPGTGKTHLAAEILSGAYANNGMVIQFHPNTSYEAFIGGLAPTNSQQQLGLSFEPQPGFLMQAAAEALRDPSRNYLLYIDEINRADLGKILGEAIFLLEATDTDRKIKLAYDFGEPFHCDFHLPKNLHLLGTMNTSDRSIAILDVAVRRRFAFLTLMPQFSVVERYGCLTMQKAFQELVSIFIEHAPDDAFTLMPGHSYFLEPDESRAKLSLRVNLAPLLEEYLAQGYVGGFAEPVRAYLQEISIP